ncbi:MAG: metalloregulator ArsR/SmtB family transcription factor [Methanobacteriaceae archaeon]|jgi:DNA-binding transcriptional ArsR family regulator|nr:metalloregulator ArsR/SmtB family transcription factor [Methanobacteriaceae archaeon]MDP2836762.1 metalloregulator ArsR/SmtB family transcription factor [Methanobacteriaceae archaeon]MDP3624597.1 metalloregulator ArsR/SmtB family transcription factor [Methanobacteriaceae archaeon]
MNEGSCEIQEANESVVNEVKSQMINDDMIGTITNLFKAVGDPTRLKILYALSKKPLCVCELAALLEMEHSAISHQLRVLRDKNLVKFKKEGKMARYYLKDDHIVILIKMAVEHAEEK